MNILFYASADAGFASAIGLDWGAFSLFNCRQLIKRVISVVLEIEMVCVMLMLGIVITNAQHL